MLRANAQTPLQWSKETVESFDTLKRMLMQSPVLAIFDPSLPTFISTDASDYGLLDPGRYRRLKGNTLLWRSRSLRVFGR